jgi:hypothetical protein
VEDCKIITNCNVLKEEVQSDGDENDKGDIVKKTVLR